MQDVFWVSQPPPNIGIHRNITSQLISIQGILCALVVPTRVAILQAIAESPLTMGVLAKRVGKCQATISSHVKILEAAGLVTVTCKGRRSFVKARYKDIRLVCDVMV